MIIYSLLMTMKSNVQDNKKYIRENISPQEQAHFYNYFLSLPDSQLFQSWSAERTAEAVRSFRHQHLHSPPLEAQGESIQELEQRYSSPERMTLVEVKSKEGSKTSSLNLLQEIEEKKAFKTSQSKKAHAKQQNWLNVSNFSQLLSTSDPSKFNPDLFRNFDSIITKPAQPNNQQLACSQQLPSKQDKDKSPQRMSMPVISAKKQEKKRRMQTREEEAAKSSAEKSKGGQKDKLFRVKLTDSIKCKQVQGEHALINIQITQHEMVHRIFLPDYAMYSMQVHPPAPAQPRICKRTYDDFILLRSTLQNLYPYVRIPYLESASWLSENDIVLIKKNKAHLQLFMRSLLSHPLLSRLPITTTFLTVPEHKHIKTHLQNLQEKAIPARSLQDVCSLSGSVGVELSSQQYQLIQQLPRWEGMFSDYFQRYGDLLSTLGGQLEAVEQTYAQLIKLASEMQAILKQLAERNTQIERQEDFEQFFRKQQEYYAQRKRQNDVEIRAITENLIPLTKYERQSIAQFRPDFQSVQKLTEKYLKRLQNEPESPRSAEDVATIVANNSLGEDMWEQSENMQFFKLQLGFLHSSLLQETHLFSSRLIDTLWTTWQQLYGGPKKGKIQNERMSIRSCN